MKIAGIVAEYNPFHTGHAYQIACTRAQLGGGLRHCGGDERPLGPRAGGPPLRISGPGPSWPCWGARTWCWRLHTVWAVSSAETFARGAVELLAAAQVMDVLSFGSECGEADKLRRVAICLNSPEYETGLRALWRGGPPSPPPGRGR